MNRKMTILTVLFAVAVTAAVLLYLGVGGDLDYKFDDCSFTVHTSLWKDLVVYYADIEGIELRDVFDVGERPSGYGSEKLNLGTFRNEEFGEYKLYGYAGCSLHVVLRLRDRSIIAINGEDRNATEALFALLCDGEKQLNE